VRWSYVSRGWHPMPRLHLDTSSSPRGIRSSSINCVRFPLQFECLPLMSSLRGSIRVWAALTWACKSRAFSWACDMLGISDDEVRRLCLTHSPLSQSLSPPLFLSVSLCVFWGEGAGVLACIYVCACVTGTLFVHICQKAG